MSKSTKNNILYQDSFQMAETQSETKISCHQYNSEGGKGYQHHSHCHYEFSYVVEGDRYEYYENEMIKVGKGSLFFLEPLSIHGNSNITKTQDIVIQFSYDFLSMYSTYVDKKTVIRLSDPKKPYLQVEEGSEIHNLLTKLSSITRIYHDEDAGKGIIEEIPVSKRISRDIETAGLTLELISLLLDQGFIKLTKSHLDQGQVFLLEDLINTMLANPVNIPSMEEASRISGMSYYSFSRFFKQAMGINYKDYCKNVRLQYACELLVNTTLSIEEIASSVGIESSSYLTRMFKSQYNITPNKYRKKYLDMI